MGGAVVSNHLSYLDILLYSSVQPFVMVAKTEVRGWPLLGWLTAQAGTVYVQRGGGPKTYPGVNAAMAEAYRSGLPVLFFPEGTTTDGAGVLPFRRGLFHSVLDNGVSLRTAALRYSLETDAANGGATVGEDVCWWGEMGFTPHLFRLLGLRGLSVEGAVWRRGAGARGPICAFGDGAGAGCGDVCRVGVAWLRDGSGESLSAGAGRGVWASCLIAIVTVIRFCRGDLLDQCGEEAGELLFCAAADLHDVFVVDGFGGFLSGGDDAGGHVGDEGDAEDFEAHVAGDDGLVDGGHADEVGAEGAEGADLGGGLEAGAEDGEVDAFGEVEALAGGLFDGEGAEARGVGGGHVEETLAGAGDGGEAGFVGAEGGVGSGEVDVVGDGDERALLVAGVDAAGGVGDDEGFAAEEAEDAGGEGDLGEGVALVGVDAALHDGDGDAGDGAEDEVAGVAFDGGAGEVGDLGVGDAWWRPRPGWRSCRGRSRG